MAVFTQDEFGRLCELRSSRIKRDTVLMFQYNGVERYVEYQEPQGSGFLGFEVDKDGVATNDFRSYKYGKIEGDIETVIPSLDAHDQHDLYK